MILEQQTERKNMEEKNIELIYEADHDKRYAHIHPMDRHLYPDEIILGGFLRSHIKRTKPLKEVTLEEAFLHGVRPHLLANDTPYTEGCIKV